MLDVITTWAPWVLGALGLVIAVVGILLVNSFWSVGFFSGGWPKK